jgi:hypothetical protein
MRGCPVKLRILAALAAIAVPATAQSIISAKAGLIHKVEGRVLVDGKVTDPRFGQFPELKESSVIATERGRAEVLLGPGTFVRLAEDASMRMVSSGLTDTRVELLAGSMLVECTELLAENHVRLLFKDAQVDIQKAGLYRLNAEPAEFLVYDGKAALTRGDLSLAMSRGRYASLDEPVLAAKKFDPSIGDSLYRWSARRSGYIATANVSAARMVRDGSYSFTRSSWFWNPYLGLMTFVPVRGGIYSPFGWSFWSPQSVYVLYRPRPVYTSTFAGGGYSGPTFNPSLGYNTVSGRTYNPAPAAAPSPGPAAAPAPAASPRASEASSGRGGAGGGRGN